MFAHSRDPHPAIKLWCQVHLTKSKTTFQIEMYCMQCFLKSEYIKNRTVNDKNRWIIKKVMVFKKLLQHLATRGTYSPGDWGCDEAWREQTLVYPPVMCRQGLIYCTWELNVMAIRLSTQLPLWKDHFKEAAYVVTMCLFVSVMQCHIISRVSCQNGPICHAVSWAGRALLAGYQRFLRMYTACCNASQAVWLKRPGK